MQENRMRKTSAAVLLKPSDSPDEKRNADEKIEFEKKEKVNQTEQKKGLSKFLSITFN